MLQILLFNQKVGRVSVYVKNSFFLLFLGGLFEALIRLMYIFSFWISKDFLHYFLAARCSHEGPPNRLVYSLNKILQLIFSLLLHFVGSLLSTTQLLIRKALRPTIKKILDIVLSWLDIKAISNNVYFLNLPKFLHPN